jgi:hypothetical protein
VKRFAFICGAVLFAIVGATVLTRLTTSRRSDFSSPGTSSSVKNIAEGTGWVLEWATDCDSVQGFDGFRIRVGKVTTQCFGVESPLGSTAWGEYRGAGHHFAWFHYAAVDPPKARFYSSVNEHGTEVRLYPMGGNVHLGVVDLGATEPYGVQFLAQDGTLLSIATFLTYSR